MKGYNMTDTNRRNPDSIVTIDTWQEYSAGDGDIGSKFFAYLDATEHITKEFRVILDRSLDFETLKREMLVFLVERDLFVQYASSNLP